MSRDIPLSQMNLGMAMTEEMLAIAVRVKPEDCRLVLERA